MDRARLADFLRSRREALQPEEFGLPRGSRRRTGGLRREEVAQLCGMSADYYGRIEQQRGPQPSGQILAAIARGLDLSPDERDHLFRLAGRAAPARDRHTDRVNPGMRRVLERLGDAPAQVMTPVGETLLQNRLSVALTGDETRFRGLTRSVHYRWFTDPLERLTRPPEDHAGHDRIVTASLHEVYARDGRNSRAGVLVESLMARSPLFARSWRAYPVTGAHCAPMRLQHQDLGVVTVQVQILVDPDQSQFLAMFSAAPGSESEQKLRSLASLSDVSPRHRGSTP